MTFFTLTLAVRLVTTAIVSLGFAILFHVARRHLPLVSLCGLGTYFIFYTVIYLNGSNFSAALLSTLYTALFAGFAARIRHAPTVLFLIPGIIPTVPGASLYNTMHHAISGEWNIAFDHLLVTLEIGFGIAGGILLVSVIFGLATDFYTRRRAGTPSDPKDGDITESETVHKSPQ